MKRFKILYSKKKSWLQDVAQKIFLIFLTKFFPKKSLIYKNKIKILIGKTKLFIFLLSRVLMLRLQYPLYFNLPKLHLYGIYLLIKFSNFFNTHNINFFLVGGTLLGAIRQESFAGRPTDIDIGITEEELPKLLKLIPILYKTFNPQGIRRQPPEKLERLQFLFGPIHFDIGVFKKVFIDEREVWLNEQDKNYLYSDDREKEKNIKIKRKINTFSKKDLEDLISVKLYGKYFLAPLNSNLFLEQKYGKNWKIPDQKQYVWKKNK